MAEMYSDGKQYLGQLMTKAREYIRTSSLLTLGRRYNKVESFYRFKSEDYFMEVEKNKDVMVPIIKDCNGDPRSPINGEIAGVFLGVSLFNGRLPNRSPFGNTRVSFPIEAIFTEGTNMYFTDFYCTVSDYHYVTLVLTKADSPVDNFCDSKLLKLDPSNNPFLWTNGNGFNIAKSNFLIVEIFYTENIDLKDLKRRFGQSVKKVGDLVPIGQGSSTPGGLLKDPLCLLCNPTSANPVTIPP